MFLYKNIKLFVICALMAVYIQAYSVSQIGDIRIEKSDDKWLCDMIECPLNSDRCFISKSNAEPSVLKRINICYSKDNTILAQKSSSTPINPNNYIRQYINSYQSGAIFTTSDSNAKNIDEKTFNVQLNREMTNLQTNLDKTLEEIDRNIQSEMQNLKKTLEHDLANLFY